MQITNELGRWQLVPLVFMQDEVAASQTAAAMAPAEVNGPQAIENVGYTVPFAGEVVGVSINVSAAAAAGALSVAPTIATTAVTSPAVSVTTGTAASDTCTRGTNPFSANAVIGAKITTSVAWDGTGSDVVVIVWILQRIEGI